MYSRVWCGWLSYTLVTFATAASGAIAGPDGLSLGNGGYVAKRNFARPYELALDLDTAIGNPINNVQNSEPIPPVEVANYEARFSKKFPRIIKRTTGCTDTYNCHGLVFASRRTRIWEPNEVRKILREDSYEKVEDSKVLPGDVALYVHAEGSIDHAAIVVEAPEKTLLSIPKVVSKWGPWAEVVHYSNECPWAQEQGTHIEYYRLVR